MCKDCEDENGSGACICDNGCGTIMCLTCGEEWYRIDGVKTLGHNPKCGDDSD